MSSREAGRACCSGQDGIQDLPFPHMLVNFVWPSLFLQAEEVGSRGSRASRAGVCTCLLCLDIDSFFFPSFDVFGQITTFYDMKELHCRDDDEKNFTS